MVFSRDELSQMANANTLASTLDDLTRKELQALAKEYKVCRANAKSTAIIDALKTFAHELASKVDAPDAIANEEIIDPIEDDTLADAMSSLTVVPTPADEAPADETILLEPSTTGIRTSMSPRSSSDLNTSQSPQNNSTNNNNNNNSSDHTDSRLVAFVNSRDDLEFEANGTNVRCTVTNHSLPKDLEVICGHLGGRAYRIASDRLKTDFSKFGDAVCEHPTLPGKLFCPLTKATLNRREHEVRQHLSGKNYQKALAQATAGDENGGAGNTGRPLKLKGVPSPKGTKTLFVDSSPAPRVAVFGERNPNVA